MKRDAFHDNGGSRSSIAAPVPPKGSSIVVLTDLDGTLLDHDTYDWHAAQSALDLCRLRNIPVVLVSSKTRAEMDVLRRTLALADPFISENGGGIFFPGEMAESPPQQAQPERGLWKWTLGSPYGDVVSALKRIRKRLKWKIAGFADMSVDEISTHTGLDRASARLAAMREPFRWEGASATFTEKATRAGPSMNCWPGTVAGAGILYPSVWGTAPTISPCSNGWTFRSLSVQPRNTPTWGKGSLEFE
ncbi:MAG: HAD-IIB family hydrolase [Deltaproteobacteria bacterium]|nr:HAD-IIB family hydrolase [Deltaproteobacteria bacterium]